MLRVWITVIVGLALSLPALGQEDESILVDLKVNYGVAYRAGSWVPVDVYIRNTERDVVGFVEIRTYDFNGQIQSPTYRLPAESPRQSQKRFRLYCKLERADRIEAQLYHGNRPAAPGPARLQAPPIDRQDYLGLVLDDTHHDYGFLSHQRVIGQAERRFHREGLTTEELGYLADHLSCYTAFDLIVMGNIDAERISATHRELIRRYVSLGGTLVVNLGGNANRYKGTWVEEFAGISIGANTFLGEPVLANKAFGVAPDSDGLTANREGMFTAITATHDRTRSIGQGFQAGSIRPVGSGRVVTFSVDAVSGLLQHQPDYLDAWNRFLQQSIVDRPLTLDGVVEAASQNLPRIAGVRLFPVSSVITYLLLYFFIAVVGNWLFWNWMKRREMAWVCLVFFSLAFTSYAMIFGTQGRARTTQLEQLEVLEMSSNNNTAINHAVTGLLAKGSGRFEATLVHSGSLLSDAAGSIAIGTSRPGGLFGPQSQNPFHFVQSDPGRVENLTVGASEMRFIRTETPHTLDGALETDLTVTNEGLQGTITNNTGFALSNVTLLHEGRAIRLGSGQREYEVAAATVQAANARSTSIPPLDPEESFHIPDDAEAEMRRSFQGFLSSMPQLALYSQDRLLPPCLLAWVDGPPLGSVDMGDRASLHLGATLLVAWLDVRDDRILNDRYIDLPVMVAGDGSGNSVAWQGRGRAVGMSVGYREAPRRVLREPATPTDENWVQSALPIRPDAPLPMSVTVPEWARGHPEYALEITVTTEPVRFSNNHGQGSCTRDDGPKRGFQLPLMKDEDAQAGDPLAATDTTRRTTTAPDGTEYTSTVYRLDDWESQVTPRTTTLHFRGAPRNDDGQELRGSNQVSFRRGEMPHYHAHVSARLINTETDNVGD